MRKCALLGTGDRGDGAHVRLMPAAYVKAYLKRNTTDAADAGAICEAVTHPTMPYVAVKGQQERQQVSFSEL